MLPAMPDPALRDAVLIACSARDDPRFLARIAFGIVEPKGYADETWKRSGIRIDECL